MKSSKLLLILGKSYDILCWLQLTVVKTSEVGVGCSVFRSFGLNDLDTINIDYIYSIAFSQFYAYDTGIVYHTCKISCGYRPYVPILNYLGKEASGFPDKDAFAVYTLWVSTTEILWKALYWRHWRYYYYWSQMYPWHGMYPYTRCWTRNRQMWMWAMSFPWR